ncbi:hypothetical protein TNIN_436611 [Trichonephila inaurata madagascariensis]|uniref:Uncharacterized protein n=1 Tax=Trichonephila inaurata madagascariensis TaxID=2747483 RepID=A0A8X6WU68_9ARAC|nr:hypothetical protein TNIN_436611 [Trichonephila inaurata madagascariensis]
MRKRPSFPVPSLPPFDRSHGKVSQTAKKEKESAFELLGADFFHERWSGGILDNRRKEQNCCSFAVKKVDWCEFRIFGKIVSSNIRSVDGMGG